VDLDTKGDAGQEIGGIAESSGTIEQSSLATMGCLQEAERLQAVQVGEFLVVDSAGFFDVLHRVGR
jgi:hypothetical protein